jgi:hypothetical protein
VDWRRRRDPQEAPNPRKVIFQQQAQNVLGILTINLRLAFPMRSWENRDLRQLLCDAVLDDEILQIARRAKAGFPGKYE